jgi:transposase InsO family protein
MEQRVEFVIKAVSGASISSLCREYSISRTTGYKWLNRYYDAGGINGIQEKSRRPKCSPFKTDDCIEERVIELRQKHGWGAKKLRVLLGREGIELSVATINRILDRNGLVEADERHKPATKRFEKSSCNELWQMDFKGEWKVEEGFVFPLTIIDDHSRYSIGVFALPGTSMRPVQDRLVKTFCNYGLPEAMLMDHGSPWWSTTNGHGLTGLSVFMIKQGINLRYSGVRHPQTQGKVERFHRSLKESVNRGGRPQTMQESKKRLEKFRQEYNEVRPHESLDMNTPASCYHKSPRMYNPNPSEWEYPMGANVTRLNSQGMLPIGQNRYFVSEALAGERVQFIELEKKLLVKFRNVFVREICPETGRTTAVVLPVSGFLL